MGLVDMPKPEFGRSNDRSTLRKFFENSAQFSKWIHKKLIHSCRFILLTISSGHCINRLFYKLLSVTTRKFVGLYCYTIFYSVHIILVYTINDVKGSRR